LNRAERKLYNKIYHKRRAEQNIAKGCLIPCGCGCGERISSVDGYGNSHSFRRGHNHRGRHYKKVNRICLICRSSKTYISNGIAIRMVGFALDVMTDFVIQKI